MKNYDNSESMTKGVNTEAKRFQEKRKAAKREPEDAIVVAKVAKSEATGAKSEPKGANKEPKGDNKGRQKGTKRVLKGNQNASKNRYAKKVAKRASAQR